tara:strand:+ start:2448 stop:4163 length:1716 start_codon:yes stop_codon:yes gene_type:complete
MSNKKNSDIRIVRGEDRFAGASNTDLLLNVNLQGGRKNIIEGDRTTILNLEERFDSERQQSTKFRIAGKIVNIFNNTISGQTSYEPFRNSLFYINTLNTLSSGGAWQGYPQFDEFTFFRTRGIEGHIPFINKSATSYNWVTYVTYPSENKTDQNLRYTVNYESGSSVNNFVVTEGVPYYILNTQDRGKNLITFYCGFKHNLSNGDWIYTKDEINGKRYFEVYELGDVSYGNQDTVFSIFNYGFDDPLFGNYSTGNFKKVIDINNKEETTSKYYVRCHKILTTNTHSDITKLGYESNPFPVKRQLEYSALTPNNIQRVSIKDGNTTVGFSFDKDIDINTLRDNLERPLTELFVTIINKGYMGWFNNPYVQGNNTGIQVGWDLNFLENTVDEWWDINNSPNRDNIPNGSYVYNGNTFFFNKSLNIGDKIMGAVCDYNEYDQKESVLSNISHKISYNPQVFDNNSPNTLPAGYTYNPHHSVPIRVYSDYIEVGEENLVDLVPDYAFLSKYEKQWRWRDLYPYGYKDTDGNGLDNPFLNGCHYPFSEVLFLLTPMKRNINNFSSVIFAPFSDDCE